MRGTYAVLNDFESPPHEMLRSSFTDDFVYEDRRRGALFPIMDAELVKEAFASFWDTGAGRPRFTVPESRARGASRRGQACRRLRHRVRARGHPDAGTRCHGDPSA